MYKSIILKNFTTVVFSVEYSHTFKHKLHIMHHRSVTVAISFSLDSYFYSDAKLIVP